MQPTTTRRRVPFVSDDGDGDGKDSRVMDEEEQETLIRELRERSSAVNKQVLFAIQAFVILSMYIHVIFFFMSFTTNPLAILLPSSSTTPRTPLSRLLDLVALFVQFNILLDLPPTRESSLGIARWARSIPHLPLAQSVTLSLAALLPVVAILARYEWQIFAWHAVSAILAGVIQTVLRWVKEGEESIVQLESLRYEAKGA